jgi:hypothetical protein
MRKFGSCIVALLFLALFVPAAKADLVFNSTGATCCFSVDLKQVNANDVLVTVTLTNGATFFANTGSGNHPGFAFNLNGKSISDSNIQNLTNLSSGLHSTAVTNGPAFGTFEYFFDIPGSGTSAQDAGPLSFDIVLNGILLSDFTANANGYYFAADLADATGATGEGAINAPPITTNQVPEPASLMLLGSGLSAAALRLRKRKK